MKNMSILKRLEAAESQTQRVKQLRAEVEARAVTPGRWEQLNFEFDTAQRAGKVNEFMQALPDGELLKIHRQRTEWAEQQATQIPLVQLDKLIADKVPLKYWTESELIAVLAGDVADGIDRDALPTDILDMIEADPGSVNWDDLRRRYPATA